MIHTIRCDQPSFKNIDFKPGFNVVMATRTLAATDKDSRNGAGKTTLSRLSISASVAQPIGKIG